MKTLVLLVAMTIMTALSSNALAAITVGQTLPPITVEQNGELLIKGDKISYANWNTDAMAGKVHVLQYLAGRLAARNLNKPLTDKLAEIDLPLDHYRVTTIINLDDAMFGTSGIVSSEFESNKKKYPRSSMVADKKGLGAEKWDLKPQGSAIFVISAEGKVLFFKDGGLTNEEIDSVIELVKQQIQQLESKQLASSH